MALVPFPGTRPADESESIDSASWNASPAGEEEVEAAGAKMSFLEHLDELRKRLLISIAALCVGFAISFTFLQPVVDFIMRPLQQMLPPGSTLIYTEPTEAFMLYLKIALISGLMLSAPVIMSQVWLFIAPGLYWHEKKLAIPFIVLTTVCFVSGALFSHYVVFPLAWRFLASFGTMSDYLMFAPKIQPVFSLYAKLLIAMGLVFQMPTIVFFLARMGLVTARFLARNIKYAVLLIFILAAVITPTGDMLTQTLMAGPMVGLYIISIGIAWVFGKPRRAS